LDRELELIRVIQEETKRTEEKEEAGYRQKQTKAASKKAARVSGGKDECQAQLIGRERDDWMGTEIGMLGGYGFQGQVTAGDGSDQKGKLGAGYNNPQARVLNYCFK